ncbi:MAG: hypothetical protein JNM84_07560 [Planctomycetes bacterium]|nr:hypothetical protein [Planctomycetota bacterium]
MNDAPPNELPRRELLQLAAGLAATGALSASHAHADAPAVQEPAPTGKLGDFALLTGEWKKKESPPEGRRHRRVRRRGDRDLHAL